MTGGRVRTRRERGGSWGEPLCAISIYPVKYDDTNIETLEQDLSSALFFLVGGARGVDAPF